MPPTEQQYIDAGFTIVQRRGSVPSVILCQVCYGTDVNKSFPTSTYGSHIKGKKHLMHYPRWRDQKLHDEAEHARWRGHYEHHSPYSHSLPRDQQSRPPPVTIPARIPSDAPHTPSHLLPSSASASTSTISPISPISPVDSHHGVMAGQQAMLPPPHQLSYPQMMGYPQYASVPPYQQQQVPQQYHHPGMMDRRTQYMVESDIGMGRMMWQQGYEDVQYGRTIPGL
ncbi:hypothetical protein IAR50_002710 [Cryptococcus sp. DSM 104548]